MNRKSWAARTKFSMHQFSLLEKRLLFTGGPDSFGTTTPAPPGTVSITINGSPGVAVATKTFSDGSKLVLAHQLRTNGNAAILSIGDGQGATVFKYDSNGSLDATFTPIEVGAVKNSASKIVDGLGLTVLADGSFIVSGTLYKSATFNRDLYLAKYSSAGAPVVGFGTAGVVTLDPTVGGDDREYSVSLDAGRSRMVIFTNAGSTATNRLVAIRTDTGALDTTFGAISNGYSSIPAVIGTNGTFTPSTQFGAMKIDLLGRVLIAGTYGTGASATLAVARLAAVGTVDTNFGSGGGASSFNTTSSGLALTISASGTEVFVSGNKTVGASSQLIAARFSNTAPGGALNGSAGTFSTPVSYSTGTNTYSVATADFNGDGRLDLVTANSSSNKIGIALGTGNGTFAAPTLLTAGVNPRGVTTGDFNNDGIPDIAVTNAGGASVSIFKNDGTGVFGAFVSYIVGTAPDKITNADMNGDGFPDLIVANSGSSNISILLGTPGGAFSNATNFTTSATPQGIVTGDFDGDGKRDIAVVASGANTVNLLVGNGAGGISSTRNTTVPAGAFGLTTGDFNGDGKLDLATANQTSNTISILTGSGTGNFTLASSPGVTGSPVAIATGDFNGDGIADLVTANSTPGTVAVLLGNGDGTFGASASSTVGSLAQSVVVGDFNSDGRLDFITANYNGNNVSAVLNNGYGVSGVQVITNFVPTPNSFIVRDMLVDSSLRTLYLVADQTTATGPAGTRLAALNAITGLLDTTFGTSGLEDLQPNDNTQVTSSSRLELTPSGSLAVSIGLSRPYRSSPTDGAVFVVAPVGISQTQLEFSPITPRDVRITSAVTDTVTGLGGYFAVGTADDGKSTKLVLIHLSIDGAITATTTQTFGFNGVTVAQPFVGVAAGRVLVYANALDASTLTNYGIGIAFSPFTLLPDISYGGGDGLTLTPGSPTDYFSFNNAVILRDGGLLAVGARVNGNSFLPQLYKFDVDGVLDPTFGSGGDLTLATLSNFDSQAVVQLPPASGGGFALLVSAISGTEDNRVQYLQPDGAADLGRGLSPGYSSVALGGTSFTPTAISVTSNGVIVLGNSGGSSGSFALVAFAPNGLPDASFAGPSGQFIFPRGSFALRGNAMLVQRNGAVFVAGSQNGIATTFRVTADGQVDTGYGPGGIQAALTTASSYTAIAGRSTDNPVVVGASHDSIDTGVLTRFLRDLPDNTAPTFSAIVPPTLTGSVPQFQVVITYTDPSDIDLASINLANLLVGMSSPLPAKSVTLSNRTATSVTATYVFDLNVEMLSDVTLLNGVYSVVLVNKSVTDTYANGIASALLGTINVMLSNTESVPPTVVAVIPATFTSNSTIFAFSVTYTDTSGIDVNTIDVANIGITAPDGSVFTPTSFTLVPVSGGYTVTYTANLNSKGITDLASLSGNYLIARRGLPVKDSLGNATPFQALGSVVATIDVAAPVVSPGDPLGPTANKPTLRRFTVRVTDNQFLGTSTFAAGSVVVDSPSGRTLVANLLATTIASSTSVLGLFEVELNPDGVVDASTLSGTYTIRVLAGKVSDTVGNFAAAGTVVTGTVNFAPDPTIVTLTAPQTTGLAGGQLFASATVLNNGNAAVIGGTISFFLSTADRTTKTLLTTVSVGTLAVADTFTASNPIGFTTPAGLAPGDYFLGVTFTDQAGHTVKQATIATVLHITAPPPAKVGGLDPTFGNGDGRADTYVPTNFSNITAPATTNGQSVLIAGNNTNGSITVFRLDTSGLYDPTLKGSDGNGYVNIDFRGTKNVATVVLTDKQGRTLIVGYSLADNTGVAADMVLARLNPDGSYDTTFGQGGKLILTLAQLPAGASNVIRAAVIDSSGRIYLAGSSVVGTNPAVPLLIRLNSNGTLDTSFNKTGLAATATLPVTKPALTKDVRYGALLLTSGNRIMVAGSVGTRVLAVRFATNGTVDTKFATKGVFVSDARSTSDRATTLINGPGGSFYIGGAAAKVVAGNVANSRPIVVRLTSAGVLDKAFAKGILTISSSLVAEPFTVVMGLILQVDNRVLISIATANSLASAAAGNTGTSLTRVNDDGKTDKFFNQGKVLVSDPAPLVTAAANPVADGFEAFTATRKGAAVALGGSIRSLSIGTAGAGTRVQSGQLTADAADLAVTLSVRTPKTVKPGFKGTATLKLSNAGSISANGKATAQLTFAADSDPSITFTLSPQTFKVIKLAAGTSNTFTINFTVPTKAPANKYRLSTNVVASGVKEVSLANNAATAVAKADLITVTGGTPAKSGSLLLAFNTGADSATRRFFAKWFSTAPVSPMPY